MSLISVLLTSGYWFGITTMTDVSQARIFYLIACLLLHLRLHLAPLPLPLLLPPPCFVASFIFLLSASHPSYSSLPESCKAVRLEFQFPPYVPAQLSTPGQGGRIGGIGLAARTTAVLISSAGACWSPRCEVSPKRVSMACLVCGTGKSPLRRNLRTRILISAVLVY